MLFRLSTLALGCLIVGLVFGSTLLGIEVGRRLKKRGDHFKEPVGVTQGALAGLVALILAFGLTMGVGRYQSRRDAVVLEANAIGTTYLRAQLLEEPQRTESINRLKHYADLRIDLSDSVPESQQFKTDVVAADVVQRQLWGLAGDALARAPSDNATRLYIETLNEMIDADTTRIAALGNRIPSSVSFVQIIAAMLALGVMGMYVAMLGRGTVTVLLAAGVVSILMLVMFDLDRPHRGFITVPAAPLEAVRASMVPPPAAQP